MQGVWGWRGKLGKIAPSTVDREASFFYQVVPEGVGLMAVTLGISELTADEVEIALSKLDDATKRLAEAGADCISLGGTPLVLIRGYGWDKELIKRMEAISKLPSTTTLTATVEALSALSVKRLIIATPFEAELVAGLRKFFEDSGFRVVNTKGLNLRRNSEIRRLPMHAPYALAKEAYLETPEADGIYIPCGGWGCPEVIECLETDLGKPVVMSDQAAIWVGLRALNIRERVTGYGRLFDML